MGKKSCVIIVENLPLPLDRRVWQEANALKENGWDVAVICPKTEKFPESYAYINGIHIYRHALPLEASGKLGFVLEYATALFHEFRLLVKISRKHGFSVIQACNPPDLIFLAVLPFTLLGKKFVFDHHDICPELFSVKFGRKGGLYQALLLFEKITYRLADRVVTANETFRRLCSARTKTAPEKIEAVYSVPDQANMRRVAANAALRHGKRVLIGYVGIIGNQDGVDHLIEAIAWLKHEKHAGDIHTLIIGDGPHLPVVRALAEELNISDNVTFTGFLSGNALLEALSTIDIGVIPDPYNEYNDKISMNKVFEYSTLGIPIASYPLTETMRLLEDAAVMAPGQTAADLGQAIHLLLNDDYRFAMSQKASAIARRKFSWEIEKKKYVQLMNALVE